MRKEKEDAELCVHKGMRHRDMCLLTLQHVELSLVCCCLPCIMLLVITAAWLSHTNTPHIYTPHIHTTP